MPIKYRTSPPCRILVADDVPDIRQLNAEVLQNFGYHARAQLLPKLNQFRVSFPTLLMKCPIDLWT